MKSSNFSLSTMSRRSIALLAVLCIAVGWCGGASFYSMTHHVRDAAHDQRASRTYVDPNSIVTLHVAHFVTTEARDDLQHLNATPEWAIQKLVDRQNAIFARSGVHLRVVSTGTFIVNSLTKNETIDSVFNAARYDSPFKNLITHTRDASGADFMMLLISRHGNSSGVTEGNLYQDRDRALSVIDATLAMPPLSTLYAHEFGHALGLTHDPGASQYNPQDNSHEGNVGFVDVKDRIRDIMSYTTECDQHHVTCTEYMYYSSKNLKFMINGRAVTFGSSRSDEVGYLNSRLNRFATIH